VTAPINGDRRVLVVIPVLGHHETTHRLLRDLEREASLADIVIVDNGGDYPALGDEAILRTPGNLGWAGGTNLGTVEGRGPQHTAMLWLNNDTRLSKHFVRGLDQAAVDAAAGIVAPVYDCFWQHQQLRRVVSFEKYRPRRDHYAAPFVDGTCMYVTAGTIDRIGLLDADSFSPIGWGADIDYCLRARNAGLTVAVTRLAYLHHEKSVTGRTVYDGLDGYAAEGFPVLMDGLRRKWGEDWQSRAGIDRLTSQTPATARPSRLRRPSSGRRG
jgi:GT2 family glycosyltransferase